MDFFQGPLVWLPAFFGTCALVFFVVGVGVMFKRKWAQQEFEELRKAHRDGEVTDPENNTVRAFTTASVTGHNRHSAADRLTNSRDSGDDSGGPDGGGD